MIGGGGDPKLDQHVKHCVKTYIIDGIARYSFSLASI